MKRFHIPSLSAIFIPAVITNIQPHLSAQGTPAPPLGLYLIETFPPPHRDQHRQIIGNRQGTVIETSWGLGHPLQSFGHSTTLPPGVYLDHDLILGMPGDHEALTFFPNLQITVEGPYYGGPLTPDLRPIRITADSRPVSIVSGVPDLKQAGGDWKMETMNLTTGTQVNQTGCALTALSMGAGYTARTKEDFATLRSKMAINPAGDVVWYTAFRELLKLAGRNDLQMIDAHQLMSGGFKIATNGAATISDDSADFYDEVERVLRSRNAMAILRVPSLSAPDTSKSHFVLCTGIEEDTVDELPLKRFRIHDPGIVDFVRDPAKPVKYWDQHSDNLLRSKDHPSTPHYEVRYFIVPKTAASMPAKNTLARSTNLQGDYLRFSGGNGVTLLPMLNGQFMDMVNPTINDQLGVFLDSPEDLSNPAAPAGTASSTVVLNPAPGNYTIHAFGSPSTNDSVFTVAIGRRSTTAGEPLILEGIVSKTTGMGSVSFSLAAPSPEILFSAWVAGFTAIPADKRGPRDDPDNDGLPNLLEYFHGTYPTDSKSRSSMTLDLASANPHKIRFRKSKSPISVISRIEWSLDLVNWRGSGESLNGISVTITEAIVDSSPTDHEIIEAAITYPNGKPTKFYLRLKIQEPP